MKIPTIATICLLASTCAAHSDGLFTGFLNIPDYGALSETQTALTFPLTNVDPQNIGQLVRNFNSRPDIASVNLPAIELVTVNTGIHLFEFDSLQDAINFAQPGHSLELQHGPYYGPYTIDGKSDLLIWSANSAGERTIDGQGAHRGFVITNSSQITIRNLTFTDCICNIDADTGSPQRGGAIYARQSHELQVNQCRFEGNLSRAGSGGAVAIRGSRDASIRECMFNGNFANLFGGGVYALNAPALRVQDCFFSDNNTFVSGGAIAMHSASMDEHNSVRNCVFFHNSSADGGTLSLDTSLVSDGATFLYDCSFLENRAVGVDGRGGAMLMEGHATAHVHDSLFAHQRAGHAAVAYLSDAAYLSLEDCAMVGNRMSDGRGEFDAQDSSYASIVNPITDCGFQLSTGNGGEVFMAGSRIDLDHCGYSADLTLDGQVNALDLIAMLQQWGPAYRSRADIANIHNGPIDEVDVADLWTLLSAWGEQAPDPMD